MDNGSKPTFVDSIMKEAMDIAGPTLAKEMSDSTAKSIALELPMRPISGTLDQLAFPFTNAANEIAVPFQVRSIVTAVVYTAGGQITPGDVGKLTAEGTDVLGLGILNHGIKQLETRIVKPFADQLSRNDALKPNTDVPGVVTNIQERVNATMSPFIGLKECVDIGEALNAHNISAAACAGGGLDIGTGLVPNTFKGVQGGLQAHIKF